MTIGSRLKEERKRLGLSQEALCEIYGISRKSQFNYERNEGSPDAMSLAKAEAVGMDIIYIITGKRQENMACGDVEREYLSQCRELPTPELKQAGLELLSWLNTHKNTVKPQSITLTVYQNDIAHNATENTKPTEEETQKKNLETILKDILNKTLRKLISFK